MARSFEVKINPDDIVFDALGSTEEERKEK